MLLDVSINFEVNIQNKYSALCADIFSKFLIWSKKKPMQKYILRQIIYCMYSCYGIYVNQSNHLTTLYGIQHISTRIEKNWLLQPVWLMPEDFILVFFQWSFLKLYEKVCSSDSFSGCTVRSLKYWMGFSAEEATISPSPSRSLRCSFLLSISHYSFLSHHQAHLLLFLS